MARVCLLVPQKPVTPSDWLSTLEVRKMKKFTVNVGSQNKSMQNKSMKGISNKNCVSLDTCICVYPGISTSISLQTTKEEVFKSGNELYPCTVGIFSPLKMI